jgi:transposase
MNEPTTFIGLDAHKSTITAAIIRPGRRRAEIFTFANTPSALAGFVRGQLDAARGPLKACYEAGPLGFGLKRTLDRHGLPTEVIAPSQIWAKPGDHIKTDRRDADKLVKQLRAGMLTVVRPPTEEEEALRDLCRAREDAKADETAAKNRLTKYLLRRGLRFAGTKAWSLKYWAWLEELSFADAADRAIFDSYLTAVRQAKLRVEVLTQALEELSKESLYADAVAALRCFRGIDTVTAMTIVTELHGFERFANPRQLMAFLGLVPSEHSSAGRGHRGSITKAGNRHVRRVLTETCWHARHRPRCSAALKKRRLGQPASVIEHADKAMRRLYKRWWAMDAHNKPRPKIVIALARELVGFIWAVLRTLPPKTAPC